MVYTPAEKKKMDNALQVFADYTAAHTDFDIAYSDKTGYVRLIIAEHADHVFFPLSSFDELMDMFCMEIISEEVENQLEKNLHLTNKDVDYDSIRLRLQRYIEKMDKAYQAQAEKVVNMHFFKRAISPYLP